MEKIRANKKIVLSVLGVLIVLVIAASAGIGLRLLQSNKAANEENVSSFEGQPLPDNVDEVQNLRVSGDINGSMKKIDAALADDNTPNNEKYLLYIQQGNAHHEKKDTNAAIASYLKAEAVDKTYEITSLLAKMYEEVGNNAKAVEYYKKSIPLIPNSPMRNQYKIDAEQKINELGGQS